MKVYVIFGECDYEGCGAPIAVTTDERVKDLLERKRRCPVGVEELIADDLSDMFEVYPITKKWLAELEGPIGGPK